MKSDPNDRDTHDPLGRDLEVTIRITRDGRLLFCDLPADMVPVALSMCPNDQDLICRAAAAEAFSKEGKS